MEQDTNELAVLFPTNEMTLAGEVINLRPFPFGKWGEVILKATGIVQIVLEEMEKHGNAAFDVSLKKGNFRVSPEAYELLVRLLDKGPDNIYDILAISARKPREWVDALEGEDGIKLLVGTFMVNKDFFTKSVAPLFPKTPEKDEPEQTDSPGEK
jgi:hypothetical protein